MSKLYRFPHLHRFDGLKSCLYVNKILEEANEVYREFKKIGCDQACNQDCTGFSAVLTDGTLLEIMDVMQACETALRNSGRTEEELLALMERHNAKDAARGYDKPREGE